MKRYTVFFSFIVCGLFCVRAETLTLEECRSRAIEYNKSLSASKLQIQKQEADLKAMRTNFLPISKCLQQISIIQARRLSIQTSVRCLPTVSRMRRMYWHSWLQIRPILHSLQE